MSSFSVLAIGNNTEDQLNLYNYFDDINFDTEYSHRFDITKKLFEEIEQGSELDDVLWRHDLAGRIVDNEEKINENYDRSGGYAVVNKGILIKAIGRTYENKKFTGHRIGFRKEGFWTLKNGTRSNQSKKIDIDFDLMIKLSGEKANNDYLVFESFMRDNKNKFPKTWNDLRADCNDEMDIVRLEYGSQNITNEIKNNHKLMSLVPLYTCPFDHFGSSKNDFIKRESVSSLTTFAIIKNGDWIEKGTIGSFGTSIDHMSESEWNLTYLDVIKNLNDNTLLSVYRCTH